MTDPFLDHMRWLDEAATAGETEEHLLDCGHRVEFWDEELRVCVHQNCVFRKLLRHNREIAKAFEALGNAGKVN